MPSIFPKRSRKRNLTTLHISFTEEKEKQTDLFHALGHELQQRAKEKRSKGRSGQKKQ